MPLRDHFHPPLSERRHWDSFHAAWAGAMAAALNRGLLPERYFAEAHVKVGRAVEIDVGAFTEPTPAGAGGGLATATRTVWTPTAAPHLRPGGSCPNSIPL